MFINLPLYWGLHLALAQCGVVLTDDRVGWAVLLSWGGSRSARDPFAFQEGLQCITSAGHELSRECGANPACLHTTGHHTEVSEDIQPCAEETGAPAARPEPGTTPGGVFGLIIPSPSSQEGWQGLAMVGLAGSEPSRAPQPQWEGRWCGQTGKGCPDATCSLVHTCPIGVPRKPYTPKGSHPMFFSQGCLSGRSLTTTAIKTGLMPGAGISGDAPGSALPCRATSSATTRGHKW